MIQWTVDYIVFDGSDVILKIHKKHFYTKLLRIEKHHICFYSCTYAVLKKSNTMVDAIYLYVLLMTWFVLSKNPKERNIQIYINMQFRIWKHL